MSARLLPLAFEGATVRTVELDGEPWFVARDVAAVLGYTNPHKAIRDHCKGVNETFTPSAGGEQTVKIIREPDVYRLIIKSRLPAAERFERWVMEEVLPAIRRTGGYGTPDAGALAGIGEGLRALAGIVERMDARLSRLEEASPVAAGPAHEVRGGAVRLDRVRARLDALGLSASAVSRRVSRSGSADILRDIWRGKARRVSAETLFALAEALQCDPAWLIEPDTGHPPRPLLLADPSPREFEAVMARIRAGETCLMSIADAARAFTMEGRPIDRTALSRYCAHWGLKKGRRGREVMIDFLEVKAHRLARGRT
ncbi:BRO family protein [Marinicauda sp. Alg238-R41]|uniref:BRO family protein n=1 Tax=Marinicauda sp. Alg238-R41 TaxID=2993447 RepID=UPI0022E67990|nr:BRO family protein [Marinicauda sp. Alg238-R41]